MDIKINRKKEKSFTFRVNDDILQILEQCSKQLDVPKSEVINSGIRLVKEYCDSLTKQSAEQNTTSDSD